MASLDNFPAAYLPQDHEPKVYDLWQNGNAFATKPESGQGYFSLVVPPPNANGNLHIGFGMTMAIEDVLARFHRSQNKSVLFVPGADHAGFETQAVFERQLAKEGKSRFDFSREELYQQIWSFVDKNRQAFERQFKQLGASVNWDSFTFTLDSKIVSQIYETFQKMWDDGLIYRGERLVNFCTYHGTAFADIEVEYRQEKSSLWYIDYPRSDGQGSITIATTRPETMFGDVAIAVNPKDKRYANLVGQIAKLPLLNKEIPIIADEAVDMEFGTGAVKITPAHDETDFEIGQRHELPQINVINADGSLNSEAPPQVRGLKIADARAKTVELLSQGGFISKIEPHSHSVGHCYKCDTVIEPLLRQQWFVQMKPLAHEAITALEAGKIKFYPDSKRRQLVTYLKNLKDWNISRQIAWGIPIPAFQSVEQPAKWIFDKRVDQEFIEVKGSKYQRDPDVFDTWFSSSSWPYSTLNYPSGGDYKNFYPLSVMETGGEILYPWVARMIMLGLYTTGEIPFKEVYIHGYVMAEDGSKMAKSVGNVVSADEMIAKYGSDALRMGLLAGRVAGVNRPFDHRRVEEARNLANKLWNASRFSAMRGSGAVVETLADHWIMARANQCAMAMADCLVKYRFNEAYEALYHFIWNDLADWYIEAAKDPSGASQATMAEVIGFTLKIAHPFAPFVTEAIWQHLDRPGLLACETWPAQFTYDEPKVEEFEEVKNLISEVRRLITEAGLSKPKLWLEGVDDSANFPMIARLGRVGEVAQGEGRGIKIAVGNMKATLEVSADKIALYKEKLGSQIKSAETKIEVLQTRLANKDYLANAPKELVTETKQQLTNQQNLISQAKTSLNNLEF